MHGMSLEPRVSRQDLITSPRLLMASTLHGWTVLEQYLLVRLSIRLALVDLTYPPCLRVNAFLAAATPLRAWEVHMARSEGALSKQGGVT